MMDTTMWFFVVCLVLGCCVGLLAGLLGIGGGLLIVPTLSSVLPWAGISSPILIMPMALATSLASIVITSLSSALSHYRLGNVQPYVIKALLPSLLMGGVIGSVIADRLPVNYLPRIFGGIVWMLALQMMFSLRAETARTLSFTTAHVLNGCIIGILSSLVGIGGGSFTVPYLTYCGIKMHKAIGTASFCGVFLAAAGMSSFIVLGLSQPEPLFKYSVGYVYLPALIGITTTSVFTTKYGAKLASRLSTSIIKRIFAVFLLLVGARMFLT
ncbi:sulfite exporter TauE/SafE family protein [Candidatus Enterovibrio escicola]|uniref:sulfite exporter TauE/SafE family protein n=1 Tax=Candidatus Enterovibrio escicola TaxID=1927127 RepID=UPI001237A4A3|nr:sulfite exporter TauE/SafE family protein [Candidatus Enterovibrio escacola]